MWARFLSIEEDRNIGSRKVSFKPCAAGLELEVEVWAYLVYMCVYNINHYKEREREGICVLDVIMC